MTQTNGVFASTDDDFRMRCGVALVGCSLSVAASVFAGYFYFFHSASASLRSDVNRLVMAAVILQGLQGLQRTVASSYLLADKMSVGLCNITGVANTFLDVASATMIVGFYYKLLTVRLPLWTPVTRRIGVRTSHVIEKYFWFVLALVFGCSMSIMSLVTSDAQLSGAYFASDLGWCQLPFRKDGNLTALFAWGIGFPAVIQMTLAIASFMSMRCIMGDTEQVTWKLHWAIYVRWCGIIVFNTAAYGVASIGLANRENPRMVVLEMCMWPFAGVVYAILFLVTEQIHPCRRDIENGFSSAISALLATEVSGVRASFLPAEHADDSIFRPKRPLGSARSVAVRAASIV
jgi:hypothetical protein